MVTGYNEKGSQTIDHYSCLVTKAYNTAKSLQLINEIKRIVLAYSGGLDTSIILKWLQEIMSLRLFVIQLTLVKNLIIKV